MSSESHVTKSALVILLGGGLAMTGFEASQAYGATCPSDMVLAGRVCIDRYEVSMVDVARGRTISPYFPPQRKALIQVLSSWQRLRKNVGEAAARGMPLPRVPDWQLTEDFKPKAVSRAGMIPQAYLSRAWAEQGCENAGKRLCTSAEWQDACMGEQHRKFPYGESYSQGRCNVYGYTHPAWQLHSGSSIGHLDPRLNLLCYDNGEGLLTLTGSQSQCRSTWHGDSIFDMVGNLDEWVADEGGVFRGGFYARSTTKGCEAVVSNHSPAYWDYSLGARCCMNPRN